MSGTFVMMHGMTGTSAKMLPLARQLVPEGWDIICPEAKIPHPTRGGYAWWLRSDNPTEPLDDESLSQVNESISRVISEIPDGPIIIGGFSQGAAIASAMLEYDIQTRIVGLVLLGTKTVRPDKLREILPFMKARKVVWMHGSRDHLVPLEQGIKHIEIFEEADWEVTKLQHEKGHMVNLNQLYELKQEIQNMANSIHR
ncbi:MAG: alpha/beta fold hydrolase [Euryarchaeota archaeon]|nr:alpha/beta fold hydrolase [Euryarchaeota archaeon]HII12654.1 alpha/beta fold hydrolase [Candidatus Thalassarchaeaceae archaeon]MBT3847164.1 alpha/beta fold hydrolase [Euryarchaeota archaeon]MBT4157088.1 alpha/beta fold hydrolase [Euryarchaeota archaeon]MBT4180610.1 alpha/beta fold hydrolase [Euryarchaeota archaeon]